MQVSLLFKEPERVVAIAGWSSPGSPRFYKQSRFREYGLS